MASIWYAMSEWLNGYAYKITMSVMVFFYAGLATLILAILTVSFESFRAALSNPVTSLRNE